MSKVAMFRDRSKSASTGVPSSFTYVCVRRGAMWHDVLGKRRVCRACAYTHAMHCTYQDVLQLDVAVNGWMSVNEGDGLKDPFHRLKVAEGALLGVPIDDLSSVPTHAWREVLGSGKPSSERTACVQRRLDVRLHLT